MISSRNNQLLIAIVLTCILSTIHAEQSTVPKRELKFELSTRSIGLPNCPSQTKYVGRFHVIKDRRFNSWMFRISNTSQWKQMSEAQRQFITKLQNEYRVTDAKSWHMGNPFSIESDYTHTPEGTVTYQVHGISEEDTRKMAEAVIEWLDTKALKDLEGERKSLQNDRNTIAEAKKILPKLEMEYKRLQALADQKIKEYTETNYGIDPKTILDHVEKSIEELARHLRDADFELVGLQAKIDLASQYKTDWKITDQDTLMKLNQMLMADEIERAGVLARRNAYEAAIKEAKEVYDAISKRDETFSQKDEWEDKLKIATGFVEMREKTLTEPRMRPVQVHENKVVIHPVRQN